MDVGPPVVPDPEPAVLVDVGDGPFDRPPVPAQAQAAPVGCPRRANTGVTPSHRRIDS